MMAYDTRVWLSLWLLIVGAAGVGVWAEFFPQAFYESFPGFGHSWVSVDGPFNEHLVRDVGGGYLTLAAVTLVAAFTKTKVGIQAAALGWLVAQIPHFIYHLHHLNVFSSMIDKVGNVVTLALFVLVPAYLLVRTVREPSEA
jgi:hypothetical protein